MNLEIDRPNENVTNFVFFFLQITFMYYLFTYLIMKLAYYTSMNFNINHNSHLSTGRLSITHTTHAVVEVQKFFKT